MNNWYDVSLVETSFFQKSFDHFRTKFGASFSKELLCRDVALLAVLGFSCLMKGAPHKHNKWIADIQQTRCQSLYICPCASIRLLVYLSVCLPIFLFARLIGRQTNKINLSLSLSVIVSLSLCLPTSIGLLV